MDAAHVVASALHDLGITLGGMLLALVIPLFLILRCLMRIADIVERAIVLGYFGRPQ